MVHVVGILYPAAKKFAQQMGLDLTGLEAEVCLVMYSTCM